MFVRRLKANGRIGLTFERGRFFVLERAHDAACATYRTGDNCKRCTGYVLHEHASCNGRAEHENDGITGLRELREVPRQRW